MKTGSSPYKCICLQITKSDSQSAMELAKIKQVSLIDGKTKISAWCLPDIKFVLYSRFNITLLNAGAFKIYILLPCMKLKKTHELFVARGTSLILQIGNC